MFYPLCLSTVLLTCYHNPDITIIVIGFLQYRYNGDSFKTIPRYNDAILSVPWYIVISSFHCRWLPTTKRFGKPNKTGFNRRWTGIPSRRSGNASCWSPCDRLASHSGGVVILLEPSRKVPCDGLASHPGEAVILLVASCWVPWDGLTSHPGEAVILLFASCRLQNPS